MKLEELKAILRSVDPLILLARDKICVGKDPSLLQEECECCHDYVEDYNFCRDLLDSIEKSLGCYNRHKYSSCRSVIKAGNYIVKIAIRCYDLHQNIQEINNHISFEEFNSNEYDVRVAPLIWVSESKSILVTKYIPTKRDFNPVDWGNVFSALQKVEKVFGITDLHGANLKVRDNTIWLLDLGV